MTPSRAQLLAGPGHPLCLGAAALILANDLVLRGWAPGWLTGKLSDLGWLVVAPVVAAALLSWFPRGERVAIALTGAFYVALQVWPPLGEALSPGHVADLGDLLVLPAIALAPLCWRGSRRPRAWAVVVGAGVLVGEKYYNRPTTQTWPCGEDMRWAADVPLRILPSGHGEVPWGTEVFHRGIHLVDEDGFEEPFVLADAGDEAVALCPRDGLRDGRTYTWTVGPWEHGEANQLEPGYVEAAAPVRFVAVGDGEPVPSSDDCAARVGELDDDVWEACHHDTGGDTG